MYKGIDVIKQYSFEYLGYAAYEANGSIAGHIFLFPSLKTWHTCHNFHWVGKEPLFSMV